VKRFSVWNRDKTNREKSLMTLSGKKFVVIALATAATLWAVSGAGQTLAAAPVTAAQVEAGRAAYAASCMNCHGDTLAGTGDAVPLSGRSFMVAWGTRTTKDLFDTVKAGMPVGAVGSLSDETYTDIVAFLLHANGAAAGGTALTPVTMARIDGIANGTLAADVAGGIKLAQTGPADAPAGPVTLGPTGQPLAARADGARGNFRANTNLGLVKEGHIPNYQPVTDAMLTNPSPNDWLMYRGNYSGWSYSKLSQINAANVAQLQLKWTYALNDGGSNETTPIIHDGVIYLVSAGNSVQAFDAVSGEVLWQNNIGPAPRSLDPGGSSDETRSIALYNDKVIVPTPQGKLYGLDARTGKVVWQSWISDPAKPDEGQHGNTGGVIVAHGKAIVGMVNCGNLPQTSHCYISAYDANTGVRAWKFATVALSGTPGGETWGKLANDQRAGAETWIAGTYDPELNTTYWGTAQAKPWRRDLRGSGDGATLYANSTLALDADTGKLKWYFSHAPGETFDLDEVFERLLIDHGSQKTLMTTGKAGILWKLDRTNGKYLDSRETVFQNVFAKIDPKTGTPVYRPDVLDQKVDQWLPSCPGPEGGHNWQAASYHQPDDEIILPLSQTCVLMQGSGAQKYFEMPGTEGNMGRLSAYQTDTMKPLWSLQQRAPFLTGVVSTAGNVAFVGDFDRVFHAFDTRTGKQLWKTRLGTTVQGYVASFAVNGKQYIAVMTGLGGGSPEQKPTFMLGDETTRPAHGTALYVFGLPDNLQQAAN
jgi:alcohol dehydrogenase (cytochrome c)